MPTQSCVLHVQANNRWHDAWATMSALAATDGTCMMSEQSKMQFSVAAPAVQERRSVFARRRYGMRACLQELEVGQKQQVWVQSQTTFACVAKNEEGQHMCKVLKQKIWVEGISYELQEIYGMEHASDGRVKTQV